MTDDVAREAFAWIESVGVAAGGGTAWSEFGKVVDDLYAGTAGVLLGCAEASAAGLDVAPVASAARDRLVHLAEEAMADDGLFDGWAGVAVALRAWDEVAADGKARDAAAAITARIAGRVPERLGDPARCTDVISGDAGILLALVEERSEHAAAAALADGLVALAEDRADGLHWRMDPTYPSLMPGFSHGTAGVAYALATAGRGLRRDDLLEVAVRAADGLLALGLQTGGGWALPLLIPPRADRPAVNFGWCHGPTGTLRLFALLDSIDPQPRWRRAVDGCLRALRDSRIPERLYPGYWDNLARCCGTAGVGQVLLDRYRATGDPALLAWSGALAEDVLGRTVPGPAWSNHEHTADPPDLPPEPGFMQGAAGIAGWLARLAEPETGPVRPWI